MMDLIENFITRKHVSHTRAFICPVCGQEAEYKNIRIREGFTKKVAVLLDFVQMREGGGRALPKFFVYFSQTVYRVNLGMGMRGLETPAQFFGTLGCIKVVQVVQIGGGGRGLGSR